MVNIWMINGTHTHKGLRVIQMSPNARMFKVPGPLTSAFFLPLTVCGHLCSFARFGEKKRKFVTGRALFSALKPNKRLAQGYALPSIQRRQI